MSKRRKRWVSAGCSATGGAHRRRGEGGDDANLYYVAGKVCYLVAADGAGGSAHSDLGSVAAVHAAMEWLRLNQLVPSEPSGKRQLQRCFDAARRAVARKAKTRRVPIEELSTTLLVAVVGEQGFLAAQVGDGALIVQSRAGIRTALWDDKPGAVNKSDFLTDARFARRVRFVQARQQLVGAVVVTDGVEGLTIGRNGSINEGFYSRLLEGVRRRPGWGSGAGLQQLLESPAIRQRCDDDLTIVAVALQPGEPNVQKSHRKKGRQPAGSLRQGVRRLPRGSAVPPPTKTDGRRRRG